MGYFFKGVKGDNQIKAISNNDQKAYKLAKAQSIKKLEINYNDEIISIMKALSGKTTGSDKQVINEFFKMLTKANVSRNAK